jgi:ubiquinone/menaquinone biosynthesis C-methylase UbiE
MPPEYSEIYQNHADIYEKLVSREDWRGNLFPALEAICPFQGRGVVEFGAGTGRLTALLAPKAGRIAAFDAAPAMIEVAKQKLSRTGLKNWSFAVADNGALPVETASADISIEGWAFGHSAFWHEKNWKEVLTKSVNEMLRVLYPGGTAIIIETLGTGREKPAELPRQLELFYEFLSKEAGFNSKWIRTDYKFASREEGLRLADFFFNNPKTSAAITPDATLPECTGIWWRKI